MIQAVFVMIGLTLDSCIVMMEKGASIRDLKVKDALLYSLIFSVINAASLLVGYLFSMIFEDITPDGRLEFGIAGLIIFFVGVFVLTKSNLKKAFVERLDKDFNLHRLIRLAMYTSIDTLCIGAGFMFFGIELTTALLIALIVAFVFTLIALYIGYNLGANYQRFVGNCSGIVMICFSLYIMAEYVLR